MNTASSPGSSPGPGRVGPYDLLEELGRGGMGSVHRARHVQTGAEHAVKLVVPPRDDPERAARILSRFHREVELLARIEPHPGVVRVHAAGEQAGVAWCAMELAHGETLASRLRRSGAMPAEAAARLLERLARAVDHIHRHGVVHRDLKPENVLLGADGSCRIIDFGVAFDELSDRLTLTGEMIGTPAFMAPEQLARASSASASRSGENQVSAATDVYALGAILYAVLCGVAPFHEATGVALLGAIARLRPVDLTERRPEIPRDLEAVCLKALEKDPARRFASAVELADDLARWLGGEPTRARPVGRLTRLARGLLPTERRRRHRLLRGLTVALAAALVIGSVALGLALRASSRAAWESDVASKRATLDRALEEGRGGSVVALEQARRHAGTLSELGVDDEELDTRRDEIDGLLALAGGDHSAARELPLDDAAWRTRRAAVVAVLVASGRTDGLSIVVERVPAVLREWATARPVAHAIVDGRIDPLPSLVDPCIRTTVEAEADPALDDAERRVLVALRTRLIGRKLAAQLSGEGRGRGIGRSLRELVEASYELGEAFSLDPETVDRLIEHATSDAGRGGDIRTVGLLVETAIAALPADDPRVQTLVRKLRGRLIASKMIGILEGTGDVDAAAGDLFDVAVVLYRIGQLPGDVDEIRQFVPDLETVKERAEEIIRRRTPAFAVPELAALAALSIEKIVSLTPEGETAVADWHAEAKVVLEHWRMLDAILRREAEDGVVPGWCLFEVARQVERVVLTAASPEAEAPAEVLELQGRALEALEAALRRRGEAARSPLERLREAVDAIYASSYARDLRHHPNLRRPDDAIDYLRWLVERSGRGVEEAEALALEILRERLIAQGGEDGVLLIQPNLRRRVDELLRYALQVGLDLLEEDGGVGAGDECAIGERAAALADAMDRAAPGRFTGVALKAEHARRHREPEEALALVERVWPKKPAEARGRFRELAYALRFARAGALGDLGRLDEAREQLRDVTRRRGSFFGTIDDYEWRAELWTLVRRPAKAANDLEVAREKRARFR